MSVNSPSPLSRFARAPNLLSALGAWKAVPSRTFVAFLFSIAVASEVAARETITVSSSDNLWVNTVRASSGKPGDFITVINGGQIPTSWAYVAKGDNSYHACGNRKNVNTNANASFLLGNIPGATNDAKFQYAVTNYPFVSGAQYLFDVDEVTCNNVQSAWYKWTFNLPPHATNIQMTIDALVDDEGVAFLNGAAITPLLKVPSKTLVPPSAVAAGYPTIGCYDNFWTECHDPTNASYFSYDWCNLNQSCQGKLAIPQRDSVSVTGDSKFVKGGENQLVFGVAGEASLAEPTGIEYRATISYDLIPYTFDIYLDGTAIGDFYVENSWNTEKCYGPKCSYTTTEHGKLIELHRSDSAHMSFLWGGACLGAGSNYYCTIPVDSNKTVTLTANWDFHTLAVTTQGGGTVTGTGIACGTGGTDCSENFDHDTVALTATADAHWVFSGWQGACSGNGPCSVKVDNPQSVTAIFVRDFHALTVTKTGEGTVDSTPAGIACGADCSENYAHIDVVLNASTYTPTTHYVFSKWEGACTNTTSQCSVHVDSAKTANAVFARDFHDLSVTKAGSGTVTGIREDTSAIVINCGSDCTESLDHRSIKLTATPTDAHWLFAGWEGACTGTTPDCTVMGDSAKSAKAIFVQDPHPLTVTTSGIGTVTSAPAGIDCGTDCTENYAHQSVVLTAATDTATTHYVFDHWEGACSGKAKQCTVLVDSGKSAKAVFVLDSHALTATKSGECTVTSTPAGISCGTDCTETYTHGTSVTLAAAPLTGSKLIAWSGGGCNGTSGCTALMNSAISVNAKCGKIPVAAFTATPAIGVAPLSVTLNYSGSYDPDGTIMNYDWLVNGQPLPANTTSSGSTKTVILTDPGTYPFRLTVTDNDGLIAYVDRTVTITPPKTLVLTNHTKLVELHGTTGADAIMQKLNALAAHSQVLGRVIKVETDSNVASAMAARGSNYADKTLANTLAGAVQAVIQREWGASDQLRYLVVVGDDRVIPFYRVADGTWYPDTWTFTDDYYADDPPYNLCKLCANPQFFVPDIAIGRLVETPTQIIRMIDQFLLDDIIELGTGAVVGWDFLVDGANAHCGALQGRGISVDCSLIGSSWNASQLVQMLFASRKDVAAINVHASHNVYQSPNSTIATPGDLTNGTADLRNALYYSSGCHSGLNVPGGSNTDWPEAYCAKGATYIGNTGYGWGGNGVILSEKLLQLYSKELGGGAATVGDALTAAKKEYFGRQSEPNWYDEKVASQFALYGLPMTRVQTPKSREESVVQRTQTSQSRSAAGTVRTGYTYSWPLSTPVIATGGNYYTLEGNVADDDHKPILPQLAKDVTVAGEQLRGVVFRGGQYSIANTPPITQQYTTTTGHKTQVQGFSAPGWYPSRFFNAVTVKQKDGDSHSIVAAAGQYNPNLTTGQQRVFTGMDFDVYHHASATDWTPPTAYLTSSSLQANTASVTVTASDTSGIGGVVVAYTDGADRWNSVVLTASGSTWTGTFAATNATEFFVQAVDQVGNVAVNDNAGKYFKFAASDCVEVNGVVTISNKTYTGAASCHASNTLLTSGTVQMGATGTPADVTFSAGTKVQLKPGFKVVAGSRFHAVITLAKPATQEAVGQATERKGASTALRTAEPIPAPQRLTYDELPVGLQQRLDGLVSEDVIYRGDAEGRFIVFATEAELDASDWNGLEDVYLYVAGDDRLLLLSRDITGIAGNGASGEPKIDGIGRYVVFSSEAEGLTVDLHRRHWSVYRYDLTDNNLRKLTSLDSETLDQGDARHPDIATEPLLVVYDQVRGDQGVRTILRQDLIWPALGFFGLDNGEENPSVDRHHPVIRADGRYLGYLRTSGDDCSIVIANLAAGGEVTTACPVEASPEELVEMIEQELQGR